MKKLLKYEKQLSFEEKSDKPQMYRCKEKNETRYFSAGDEFFTFEGVVPKIFLSINQMISKNEKTGTLKRWKLKIKPGEGLCHCCSKTNALFMVEKKKNGHDGEERQLPFSWPYAIYLER